MKVRAVIRESSLGDVLIVATERGVCAVVFAKDEGGAKEELRRRFPDAQVMERRGEDQRIADKVVDLIEGGRGGGESDVEIPVNLAGTEFQQRVWRALRQVPRGTTTTYSDLAKRIGVPGAERAVGTACGANPVAVAVPCHRVIRRDGGLGGYRWGLERKRALLERERTRA